MHPLSKEQESEISNLYYGEKFYFGRDKVWKKLRERGSKISRRQTQAWLNKQEVDQLTARQFRTKDIRPTLLSAPFQQLIIDLTDMQKKAVQGINYLLVAIDGFSRFLYVETLKNKKEFNVLIAYKRMLKKMDKKPLILRSDNGKEFTNGKFREYNKKIGIKQIYGKPHAPQSQGLIERMNGTLKTMITRYILSNDKNWLKNLPQIVENINSAQQETTGYKPEELNTDKSLSETAEKNIRKKAGKKIQDSRIKFKVGDMVRIKVPDSKLWSKERYEIILVHIPKKNDPLSVFYRLKDSKEKYYNNDLQLANEVFNEKIYEKEFKIRRIEKPVVVGNKPYFEVSWVGLKKVSDNTLEPMKNLQEDVPKLLKQFIKKHVVVFKKDAKKRLRLSWKKAD